MSTLSNTLLSMDDTQPLFILFILLSIVSMESVQHKNAGKKCLGQPQWHYLPRLVRTVQQHLEAVFLVMCNPSMNKL
jgi:hypothetical protein